jgi:hypothetical protein
MYSVPMKLGWRTSMTWRNGVEPTACRQQLEKGSEVVGVERLRRRELPDDRPELGPELGQPAGDEALDRLPGFREDATIGGVARRLDGEDEVVGCRIAPLGEAGRALRAVVGRVDLDRGDAPAQVLELTRVSEAGRIEVVAPGLVDPAADAGPDSARRCRTAGGLRRGGCRWRRAGPGRRCRGCRCSCAG